MSRPDPAVRVVGAGFSFLEAPRWHDGHLYASDFYTRRVLRFGEDGTVSTICEVDGQPSGLGFLPDGRMLVVSMLTRQLLVADADGRLSVYADLSAICGHPLNDMVVDEQGGAYVGNFGFDAVSDAPIRPTGLYYVASDGGVSRLRSDLVFPNGIAIDPAARRLYVAETYASRVSVLSVAGPGQLSAQRSVFVDFGDADDVSRPSDIISRGAVLPDGLAVGDHGDLWIADAAGHGVFRVDARGEQVGVIDIGSDLAAYAVAVGGTRTLFVCAAPPQARRDRSVMDRSVLLAVDLDRVAR